MVNNFRDFIKLTSNYSLSRQDDMVQIDNNSQKVLKSLEERTYAVNGSVQC